MKRIIAPLSVLVFFWIATASAADAPQAAAPAKAEPAAEPGTHISFVPADIKWQDAPPSLPKGSKVFVMEGNISAPGPFTLRALLPDGYKVPPHWHPAVEHVTVLRGTFYLGMGDKWDEALGKAYPVGSFTAMPQGMHHFAWAKGETVIQVHGIGPWGITYVNPSDDPRNAPSASNK